MSFENLFHSILISCSRGDPRTRSFRIQKEVDAWQLQLSLLVDAYLQYKDIGTVETTGQWPLNVVGFDGMYLPLFPLT